MNQVVLKGTLVANPVLLLVNDIYQVEIMLMVDNSIFQCIIQKPKLREYCMRYCLKSNLICVYAHLDSIFENFMNKTTNQIHIIVDDILVI